MTLAQQIQDGWKHLGSLVNKWVQGIPHDQAQTMALTGENPQVRAGVKADWETPSWWQVCGWSGPPCSDTRRHDSQRLH